MRDLYGCAGNPGGLANSEGRVDNLEAQIRLLKPYKVPYTLPLTKPAGPVEFLERQIRNLAGKTSDGDCSPHLSVPRQEAHSGNPSEAAFSDRRGGEETLVANFGAKTCAGSPKGWAPRGIRGVEVTLPW